MLEIFIEREYFESATIGRIEAPGFRANTLELPWRGNQRNVSCIPEGEYIVKVDDTGKFRIARIHGVPGRTAIEFHAANNVDDLRGCIALGGTLYELPDGRWWLYDSRRAVRVFRRVLEAAGGVARLRIFARAKQFA